MHAQHGGVVFVSIETLVAELDLSANTVRDAWRGLLDAGLFTAHETPGKATVYVPVWRDPSEKLKGSEAADPSEDLRGSAGAHPSEKLKGSGSWRHANFRRPKQPDPSEKLKGSVRADPSENSEAHPSENSKGYPSEYSETTSYNRPLGDDPVAGARALEVISPTSHIARPNSPRTGRGGLTFEADFAEFYETFPLHKSRKDALKAYVAARKQGVTAEEILAGARRYAAERAQDFRPDRARFTKHPGTWLRAGCWSDDPTPPPALRSNGNGFHQLQGRMDGQERVGPYTRAAFGLNHPPAPRTLWARHLQIPPRSGKPMNGARNSGTETRNDGRGSGHRA